MSEHGRLVRGIVAVFAALILLRTAAWVAGSGPGGGGGDDAVSSAYSTGATGLAAYAELLRRDGRRVELVRGSLAAASDTTVVVLDPVDVTDDDARSLAGVLAAGGTVIAGGHQDLSWLRGLVPDPPRIGTGAPSSYTSELAPVRRVRTAGEASWTDAGSARPLVTAGGTTLLAVAQAGAGRLWLLADPSPLQNRLLASADNAALGLHLATGRVLFAERLHGYGDEGGFGALPPSWRFALAGLALAAALWMLSRGRLGPPALPERDLPPPRRAYVDAVSTSLRRTRRPSEATAPVASAVREAIARRAGLAHDAGPDELEGVAVRLGFRRDEIDAVLRGASDDRQLLALGRALARSAR